MTEWKIQVGGIAQLKSGGPKLVIREVDGADVTVDWFDKSTARSAIFKAEQLRAYEDEIQPAHLVISGVDLPNFSGPDR